MDILTEITEIFKFPPEEIRSAADEIQKLHDVLYEIADSIENNDEEKRERLIGKLAITYYNILQK